MSLVAKFLFTLLIRDETRLSNSQSVGLKLNIAYHLQNIQATMLIFSMLVPCMVTNENIPFLVPCHECPCRRSWSKPTKT